MGHRAKKRGSEKTEHDGLYEVLDQLVLLGEELLASCDEAPSATIRPRLKILDLLGQVSPDVQDLLRGANTTELELVVSIANAIDKECAAINCALAHRALHKAVDTLVDERAPEGESAADVPYLRQVRNAYRLALKRLEEAEAR